jgi:hypothetical protein
VLVRRLIVTCATHPSLAAAYGRPVAGERGQATVEWVGLMLLVGLAAGAALAVDPPMDGRSLGGFLAHRIVCAVRGGCADGDAALAAAYGRRDAELVRRLAPGIVYESGERELPVDPRRCRTPECARAPDDRRLDVHRSDAGARATAFTRVLHRGGRTYLQYWLYYPDSNTAWAGSDRVWEESRLLPLVGRLVRGTPDYPGYHADDWEGAQIRVDPDGRVWARATSHGHYQGCKRAACRNRWVPAGGWTRVSRGSHAGHVPGELLERRRAPPRGVRRGGRRLRPLLPGRDLFERTSTAEGLRLIPLETMDHGGYRAQDEGIDPPWRKEAYRDPESDRS